MSSGGNTPAVKTLCMPDSNMFPSGSFSTTMSFCIERNPDISGIGVRIAIYAQNLLSFAPAVIAVWDGNVSADELKSMEGHSVGMLAIAFAILITTVIQATSSKGGISGFHAAVVLDLSWMNNTTTFIWFILYAHHRGKSQPPLPPTFSAWTREIISPLRRLIQSHKTTSVFERFRVAFSSNIVLLLGSIHLTLMAAIGLWMWSNPTSFAGGLTCDPSLAVIGANVSLSSKAIRAISLVIYSVFLMPGINLLAPFLFFLVPHIIYNRVVPGSGKKTDVEATAGSSTERRDIGKAPAKPEVKAPPDLHIDTDEGKPRSAVLYGGLMFLLLVNLVFILDVELTLSRNKHLEQGNEQTWGFGQILALLLLVIPLRDFVSSLSRIRHTLKNEAQRRFDDAVRIVLNRDPPRIEGFDVLALLQSGVDADRVFRTNYNGNDTMYIDMVQLACRDGDVKLVEKLLKSGADPTLMGPLGNSLHIAAQHGHADILQLLLKHHGVDPNSHRVSTPGDSTLFPHFNGEGSALHIATRMGYLNIVQILLKDPRVDPNLSGPSGSPLNVAARHDQLEIAERLLEGDADPTIVVAGKATLNTAAYMGMEQLVQRLVLHYPVDINLHCDVGGTPLQAAILGLHIPIVRFLLEHGADPNTETPDMHPLTRAAGFETVELVTYLLDHGANVNHQSARFGTALIEAAQWQRIETVKILFDHGADPNITGGEFHTALQAACSYYEEVPQLVQILFDTGADPRLQGGRYGSALGAAMERKHARIIKMLEAKIRELKDLEASL